MLRSGWTPWSGDLEKPGSDLQGDLARVNPEAFSSALLSELTVRHDRFLTGLEAYRTHAYRRNLSVPPPLWEQGPIQLRDYGTTHPAGENGRPLLVVPSLVNRSYILDLTENTSFLRFLAARGYRPLLVDWGTPGKTELAHTMEDCIAGILREILSIAVETASDAPVPVMGYCMGGTLATALATLEPEKCAALVLLATPWDFHAGTGGPPPAISVGGPALEQLITASGCLPVDALQTMFFSLDPLLGWNKFRAFAEMDPDSERAEIFVALEDWLNDGVPLAADIARTCLFEWYGENRPAKGIWEIGNRTIDPADIDIPTLGVLPANDRIVPPASAGALLDRIRGADTLTPAAGHIGMMVGGRAKKRLWSPLADWLDAL